MPKKTPKNPQNYRRYAPAGNGKKKSRQNAFTPSLTMLVGETKFVYSSLILSFPVQSPAVNIVICC